MGYPSAVRAALATAGTNVTLLWMCNFPMGVSSWSPRLKRSAGVRLLGLTGAIAVCPSTAIRDELEALGYPLRQLRVVRNGVDIERIRRCSMSNDERRRFRAQHRVPSADLVATCVARVDPVKNHQLLIRAVAHAARQGIRVALICAGGSDPGHRAYAEELRRLADELGVADRILWLGHSDEVSQWLAASDVVVLASRMEAGPRSLVEAAAAGLPLVASCVGGIPEIVIPARTGYLFSQDDPEECARVLVRLAGNEAERRALGTQARRLVELEFSEKSMDAKWSELIGGLIDPGRHSLSQSQSP
jgi:glycosyltransferase involved in cell wall biosynthesis